MNTIRARRQTPPRAQRGVVLYVALIMLLLLALLGITAMQVTGLQERMTSNYRSTNMAFQNAEGRARGKESDLKRQVQSAGTESIDLDESVCTTGFDPSGWAEKLKYANPLPAKLSYTRRIDECISGGGIGMGTAPVSENTNLIFQVTAYAVDRGANPGSDAVIDTIFVP
ncbi:pilus assembly PilX family protein [Lysobacter antibioticus]|uniref:PilX N-terminal family protein n=1 Tax=Lysobacter antibioticus TaxID=84531 RepID=A0A0S2F8N7_LYSAN|nr:PilX N-terminal domain-containing pilus assembly protein [Lysobacter antibioticus]ALN79894.1 pilX N-terminal family protein [Lysobacter antibioticus]